MINLASPASGLPSRVGYGILRPARQGNAWQAAGEGCPGGDQVPADSAV